MQLVALGIATWGTLHNRDQLIKQSFHGTNPVSLFKSNKFKTLYTMLVIYSKRA